jgi:para-aminobenzoate synthetase component I
MLPQIHQLTRTSLPGPPFLDFVASFSAASESLAVLHSGNLRGHSVLARVPLLDFQLSAIGKPIFTTHNQAPSFLLDSTNPEDPPLDQWSALVSSIHINWSREPLSPLAGWLGQIAYDIGRTLENVGTRATDDTAWPLLHWQLFDEYFLFDHAAQTWTLATFDWPGKRPSADDPFADMIARLQSPGTQAHSILPAALVAFPPANYYRNAVARAKDYITAGDTYQVNLAQRWTARTAAHPVPLFLALCKESPAEFSALLLSENRAAISASPELLLQFRDGHLVTRPIKGTRPRDLANAARDAFLALNLFASEKDQAELAMIVDLLRNDLGRVAGYGSVHVTVPRALEKLPTVWHTSATIEADLPCTPLHDWLPDDPRFLAFANTNAALVRALCPGGSVTGAPKIRAMQIIDELEPHRRGLYCGNIGAIRGSQATFNIAIRTIQMTAPHAHGFHAAGGINSPSALASSSAPASHLAHIWSGAGIVADSDPALEHAETLHKAAALFHALNLEVPHE